MNVLLRIFGFILAIIVGAAGAAYIWSQDTDRVKQELETVLNDHSAYQVDLQGDIQWQLLPFYLKVEDIVAIESETPEGQKISVKTIEVSLNTSAMWRSVDTWQIDSVTLGGVTLTQGEAVTRFNRLEFVDLKLDAPIKISAEFNHNNPPGEEVSGSLKGFATYTEATADSGALLTLTDLHVETNIAQALCQIDALQTDGQTISTANLPDDAILPLDTLMGYDFSAECDLSNFIYAGLTAAQARLEMTNTADQLDLLLSSDDFYQGMVNLEVNVDYAQQDRASVLQDPKWAVHSTITKLQIEDLLAAQQRPIRWEGPVSIDSTLTLTGNTQAQLQASVAGTTELSSESGRIDISKIKHQLQRLAILINKPEEVERWPDQWPYELMQGRWRIQAQDQQFNLALDNMSIKGDGTYAIAEDTLDIRAQVTVHQPQQESEFTINPLLVDTPIPVRCTGPGADPKCRLDERAGQSLIAQALSKDSDTGVRRKLEEKIDEKVPEEYRDLAKDLLDLLGRSLN
ncbi:MAG: AsmA family protein [Pseudomonadota bacterium]